MKYSFMSFSCPEANFDELLQIAKLNGYDGIEPRIVSGHKHGIETDADKAYLKQAKEKAMEKGISICCIATSCMFANPETQSDNIEQAKRSIELAAALASPSIRVFGGAIPANVERKRSFELVVEALKKLSDFALSHNVTICLETHDSWCNPEHVADLMENCKHPSIAVNWDIMHPVLTADYSIENSFNILKNRIKHVHIHDGLKEGNKLVLKPIGEGIIDHLSAIKLLKESGYIGFISGEWIDWEPYDIHLPRELAKLKSFE